MRYPTVGQSVAQTTRRLLTKNEKKNAPNGDCRVICLGSFNSNVKSEGVTILTNGVQIHQKSSLALCGLLGRSKELNENPTVEIKF